jgi:hypothetical protein
VLALTATARPPKRFQTLGAPLTLTYSILAEDKAKRPRAGKDQSDGD